MGHTLRRGASGACCLFLLAAQGGVPGAQAPSRVPGIGQVKDAPEGESRLLLRCSAGGGVRRNTSLPPKRPVGGIPDLKSERVGNGAVCASAGIDVGVCETSWELSQAKVGAPRPSSNLPSPAQPSLTYH